MSNTLVGSVYNTIIEEVVNSSRVDFEESGVEESALELLRVGWQRKLTQLDVARFPWDPKPDPPTAPAQLAAPAQPPPQAAPAHSQARFTPQLPMASPVPLPQNGIKTEPRPDVQVPIKQEPGLPQYQNYNGGEDKNSVAANRAAQQLQAQFGQRAAGSISAIQSQQPQHQQAPQQQNSQQAQAQAAVQQQQALYRQQMAAATAQIQQQQQQRNGQTDGPGDFDADSDDEDADFEGVLMQRNAQGELNELGRVEIDRMLHARIAAKAKSMEGGGLMLPLEEATRHQTASSRSRSKGKGIAAFDGGDEDEEEDEDAINSDLDDPADDENEDDVDDDGGLGHIMLCMYDKVQRVKNKWKCTLKDGVLTVNGKEYVFHKATGEYEW